MKVFRIILFSAISVAITTPKNLEAQSYFSRIRSFVGNTMGKTKKCFSKTKNYIAGVNKKPIILGAAFLAGAWYDSPINTSTHLLTAGSVLKNIDGVHYFYQILKKKLRELGCHVHSANIREKNNCSGCLFCNKKQFAFAMLLCIAIASSPTLNCYFLFPSLTKACWSGLTTMVMVIRIINLRGSWSKSPGNENNQNSYIEQAAKNDFKEIPLTEIYKILNSKESANKQSLKKQYYKLARKYHPDKCLSLTDQEKEEYGIRWRAISNTYRFLQSS